MNDIRNKGFLKFISIGCLLGGIEGGLVAAAHAAQWTEYAAIKGVFFGVLFGFSISKILFGSKKLTHSGKITIFKFMILLFGNYMVVSLVNLPFFFVLGSLVCVTLVVLLGDRRTTVGKRTSRERRIRLDPYSGPESGRFDEE
jgi:hypothetical protein